MTQSAFSINTPVVLIIFKRPNTTERVFEAIRQAKPSKLFVIADGPRRDREDEAEKCAQTRSIIDRVDWNCEIFKDYSDINLGAGRRVFSGLNWVFSQVEEAIIVEDDCVLDPTFFTLCEELLERYRNDNRIFTISAQNVQLDQEKSKYSYYFSRYPHIWGWATWKRAWSHYDFDMALWQKVKEENWLHQILMDDPQAIKYWLEIFQLMSEKKMDAWDYQWTFASWLQSGLSIIPNMNLVSNIGFGLDSTHHTGKKSRFDTIPIQSMEFPLSHPPFIIRHHHADQFTQKNIFRKKISAQLKSAIKKKWNVESFSTLVKALQGFGLNK